jgi:uncharacterized protein
MFSPSSKRPHRVALGLAAALLALGSASVQAQTKKELIAKVLQLQQGGIEAFAQEVVAQPAFQMRNQVAVALQRVPQDKREALARDIEADMRKYVEEAVPPVRARAVALAPTTIGALLDERFNEDELKQVIAILESPVNRKFQSMAPEMQKAIGEKLVAESRAEVDPKVRALEQTVSRRMSTALQGVVGGASAPPAAAKPAPAAPAAKKP